MAAVSWLRPTNQLLEDRSHFDSHGRLQNTPSTQPTVFPHERMSKKLRISVLPSQAMAHLSRRTENKYSFPSNSNGMLGKRHPVNRAACWETVILHDNRDAETGETTRDRALRRASNRIEHANPSNARFCRRKSFENPVWKPQNNAKNTADCRKVVQGI